MNLELKCIRKETSGFSVYKEVTEDIVYISEIPEEFFIVKMLYPFEFDVVSDDCCVRNIFQYQCLRKNNPDYFLSVRLEPDYVPSAFHIRARDVEDGFPMGILMSFSKENIDALYNFLKFQFLELLRNCKLDYLKKHLTREIFNYIISKLTETERLYVEL